MAKASKAKWQVDTDKFVVNLQILSTGETKSFDLNKLSDEMVRHAALHGVKQVLGDSFAAKETNVDESTTKKWATLTGGEWSAKRESGAPRITMLVEAVMATNFGKGKTETEIAEAIDNMSKENRKSLRANKEVAIHLKRITAERASESAAKAVAAGSKDAKDVGSLFATK